MFCCLNSRFGFQVFLISVSGFAFDFFCFRFFFLNFFCRPLSAAEGGGGGAGKNFFLE